MLWIAIVKLVDQTEINFYSLGPVCEVNINECERKPCSLGSICHDRINEFECRQVSSKLYSADRIVNAHLYLGNTVPTSCSQPFIF